MFFVQIKIGFAEHLVAVFFFDDVVKRRELQAANRCRTQELGIAADHTAPGVSADAARRCKTGRNGQERTWVTHGGPAALRVAEIVTDRPVAFGCREFRAMLVTCGEQEVAIIGIPSADGIDRIVAVRAVDQLVVTADFEAFVIVARDEVDHARHGVGAVGCGGAVFQDLDPADCGQRQDVGVNRAVAGEGERVWRQALAVQQHQGARGTETAQVDRARAFRALGASVELVGIAEHTARDRQRLDQVKRRGAALQLEIFRRQHIDGQRSVFRGSLNQRAGDRHRLELALARILLRLSGKRAAQRNGRRIK